MPIAPRSLKEVFLEALAIEPAERTAWLERECAGDAQLQRQVELMLAAHDSPQSLFDRVAPPAEPSGSATGSLATAESERAGTIIGPYKLVEQIGEGGMGTVWMAQQTEPVKRLVAVKLIKAGMDSRQILARFEAERQALALMDHPNIARVLDAGTTDTGRPYFVMDLVKGVPITRYCDEHHLTPRQRLELFVLVCQAIQHAHQKGVIHRDIKPSNVLVALYDGKPVPKVIDFGIAKAAGQPLTDRTLVTGFGVVVGTPEYMSPEQAELNQLDIDTRSDVYSLGVLLYELLAGSPPFSRKDLEKAGLLEMLRVIREQEPSKPSAKLSTAEGLPTLAANRGTEPAKLTRLVRGELDWLVMKALEKDRNRRYESANGFVADVQRYLADEPVVACPPSTLYRVRKFVRRNRGAVGAAAVILLTLVGGIVGTTIGLVRAEQARRAEVERANGEEQAKRQAESDRDQAQRDRDAKALALQKEAQERKYAQGIADFVKNDILKLTSIEGQYWAGEWSTMRLGSNATLRQLLDRAAAKLNQRNDLDPRTEAELRYIIGRNYLGLGEPALAVPFLERCVTLRKELLRPEHEDTLEAQNALAISLEEDGQLDRALPLKEETLKLRKETLGDKNYFTLLSMMNLATGYRTAEKFDIALPLYEKTLKLMQEELGAGNRLTLMCMGNLAGCYHSAGKRDRGVALLEETLELKKEHLGANDHDTLRCMNNLAVCYGLGGNFKLALPLLEEVLKRTREKYGADDPETLMSMHNLGAAYADAGQFDRALQLLDKTLKLQMVRRGADHPETLITLNSLAIAYQKADRLTEAIRLFEQVKALREKRPGPEHQETLQTCFTLARAYHHAGRVTEAMRLLERVTRVWEKKYGVEDDRALTAFNNLAMTYLDDGREVEAIRLLERVQALREKKLGANHRNTLITAGNLARAYREHGELAKAIPLYEQVRAAQEKELGADHRDTLTTLISLAGAYRAAGHPQQAIRLFEQIRPAVEQKFGSDHRETLSMLDGLAWAYKDHRRVADAIRLFEQASKAMERTLGENHPDTLKTLTNLGLTYLAAGKTPEAIRLLEEVVRRSPRCWRGDHPHALTALHNLGVAYWAARKVPEAIRVLERLKEVQEKTLPADHPKLLSTLQLLARAYETVGNHRDLIRVYEQLKPAMEKKFGANNPETLAVVNNLAVAYWSTNQLDRSIPLFEDVLERKVDVLGRDDPDTLITMANLGINYSDAGRHDKALPLLEEAYRKGRSHAALAWFGEALADAYIKAGMPKEAAKLIRDDLADARKGLPAGSVQLATKLARAGSQFVELKQYAEAEPLLLESLVIREKKAPDAWTTFNTHSLLGEAYLGQKKYADAEPLLLKGYQGMKERAAQIPPNTRLRLTAAAQRLVRLYEAMENEKEAAKWRKELEDQRKAAENAPSKPK